VWTNGLGPETSRWRVHPACWVSSKKKG
jgi:hypothetical protein